MRDCKRFIKIQLATMTKKQNGQANGLNTKPGGTILSSKLRKGAMHAFCFTSVKSGQELDDG